MAVAADAHRDLPHALLLLRRARHPVQPFVPERLTQACDGQVQAFRHLEHDLARDAALRPGPRRCCGQPFHCGFEPQQSLPRGIGALWVRKHARHVPLAALPEARTGGARLRPRPPCALTLCMRGAAGQR